MKILVCLNRDLEALIALNLLINKLKEHEVYLNLSGGVGHAEDNIAELQITESDVPFEFLFPLLNKMYPQGLDDKFKTFEQISKRYNWPLTCIKKINKKSDGIPFLEELQPDLIVSIRYGQIFKSKAISIPKRGIINLHSGILPNYRGVIATFRAMNNNDVELGTTLHYINDGTIDTGDIIGIHRIPNDKNKSLLGNVMQLYYGGTDMIKNAIDTISEKEKVECIQQTNEKAAYYSHPVKEDVLHFINQGYKLVDAIEYKEALKLFMPNNL